MYKETVEPKQEVLARNFPSQTEQTHENTQ
jgi:hypothetical protein